MLAQLVESGKLPPLDQRLPATPLVVKPIDKIGVYGGKWRLAFSNANPLFAHIGYETLTRFTPDGSGVVPNIAESIDANANSTEFTIKLRKGMKWSDGEPFTADDIMFAYKDVVMNDGYASSVPLFMRDSQNQPGTFVKVDDVTIVVTFKNPKPAFLEELASSGSSTSANMLVRYPKHYYQQFHPDYDSANVEKLLKAEKRASWGDLFYDRGNLWNYPQVPRLHAWVVTTPLGSGNRLVAERNPYYWKTDPQGSQLPYLDRVTVDVLGDAESILLKASNGDIDFQTSIFTVLRNKPVLAENRDSGGFDFMTVTSTKCNEGAIGLNLAHKDPVKRAVYNNKDFRIGLSHAIKREEIINAVLQRQGVPHQVAPPQGSEFYDEEFATQYTEYNVDLANQHLDKAGLTKRDSDGFRLGPDGKRVSIMFTVVNEPELIDTLQLVFRYWKAVGIEARSTTVEFTLWQTTKAANDHDALMVASVGGLTEEMTRPVNYFPMMVDTVWAPAWGYWRATNGKNGEKAPEGPVSRQIELYEAMLKELDEGKRKSIFREILSIAKEQFFCIGTAYIKDGFGIVRNDFHNTPKTLTSSSRLMSPGLTNPEQYYSEKA